VNEDLAGLKAHNLVGGDPTVTAANVSSCYQQLDCRVDVLTQIRR
jgi:hypothetical protein